MREGQIFRFSHFQVVGGGSAYSRGHAVISVAESDSPR